MRKTLLTIVAAAASLSLAAQETVYFQEDFEWLEPWATAGEAGSTVETDNPNATAPQIKTPKVTIEGIGEVSALQALESKGYTFHRVTTKTAGECIYLQKNYLKFGKTSYQAGITLPTIETIPEGTNVTIAFDWCSLRQASGVIDPTKLVVIVTNGDSETKFEVPEHGIEENGTLKWIPASINLGNIVGPTSKITIRNCDEQWPISKAMRWFLDNIKVMASENSGVEGIIVDNDAPVEYFNLQGMRVAEPSNGLYIRRQGKEVKKVFLSK